MSPPIYPGVDQEVALIILAPQTLVEPETKEVVADAASGGTWVHRNLEQVISMRVDGSTPGNIFNSVGIF